MPACGTNGETYRNLCTLSCQKAQFKNFGQCEEKDSFVQKCSACDSFGKRPICGTDGNEYRNECECTCQGLNVCQKYSEGSCPIERREQCLANCPGLINKQCGDDGLVYENACYRKCNGVKKAEMNYCRRN